MDNIHKHTGETALLNAAYPLTEQRRVLLTVRQFNQRNPAFSEAATRSIMSQSGAVQTAIEAGEQSIEASTKLAADVEGALNHSRDAVMRSRHGVTEITDSVSEQKIASTEIAQSMERIANMLEENNAAAHSISASTDELRTLSQSLTMAVSGFRVA